MLELNQIHQGDCLEVMRQMPDNSVDSIVTDPPYGLSFMGQRWDYDVPSVDIWAECLRVLKPGGHMLSFSGTRTQHRMAVNIEDAGFEIRDMIAWVYGSGFPKSLNVGKAIDKAKGLENIIGTKKDRWTGKGNSLNFSTDRPQEVCKITAPASTEAAQWDGWGSALKPALEPITLARKPLSEKTIAANVLTWGCGGVNVDGCRVEGQPWKSHNATGLAKTKFFTNGETPVIEKHPHTKGRFPANLILDDSDEVRGLFPETKSGLMKEGQSRNSKPLFGSRSDAIHQTIGDSGSAARFFYCAKASKSERGEGNVHPTVKPVTLIRYLVRLITQPDGIVLDPFFGSGTTGIAAKLEGFDYIGIEREADYIEIAKRRIDDTEVPEPKPEQMSLINA